MIEFVWPWMFVLLPLPLLARWWLPANQRGQAALTVPSVDQFRIDTGPTTQINAQSRIPLLILALAWACLVTASARPQWTGDIVDLPVTGRDLMLAVDISGSMGTEDMRLGDNMVNRLKSVKAVVSNFIDTRQGDRVGLILFGTQAYLQAPLTFDLASVTRLLVEAPVGIAGGKTAIGDAIGLAVKRLRQRPQEQRVVILLTDGANNVGQIAPIKASELAAQAKVKIYTIGFGAEEMRMSGLFGSRLVNPSADLDTETLEKIASNTNGRFFRAQSTGKLDEIYQLIDDLEPVEQEPEAYRPVASLYYWPLGLATLLVLGLIIRTNVTSMGEGQELASD